MFARPSNNWLDDRNAIRELATRPTAMPVVLVHPPKPRAASPVKRPHLKTPITFLEAQERGYKALTSKYGVAEQWMLDNVVADMERGQIDYQLVGFVSNFGAHLVEVWRKGMRFVNVDGKPRYGYGQEVAS